MAELVAVPSPAGGELAAAEAVGGWLTRHHPEVDVEVDRFASGRANLEVRTGDGPAGHLVVYSHLDTTLSGNVVLDRMAVPDAMPSGPLVRDGDLVAGHGVCVAKGPAAAATIGYVLAVDALRRAQRPDGVDLLLAAGGTHRAAPPGMVFPSDAPTSGAGAGVRRYLERWRPAAAVVAKCGPPGVLWEEPGAAYVTVEARGDAGIVMSRPDSGGVPAAAGAAIGGVERWRRQFRARPLPAGSQVGREAGVGSLAAGVPYKADLLGGLLQLHLYLVLGPGDHPELLVPEIEAAVGGSLAGAGWRSLEVRAVVVESVRAAATSEHAEVVKAAVDAYRYAQGHAPPPVSNWTGSTDGVVLREGGVETVRLGPVPEPRPPGHETLSVRSLVTWAKTYAELVVRYGSLQCKR